MPTPSSGGYVSGGVQFAANGQPVPPPGSNLMWQATSDGGGHWVGSAPGQGAMAPSPVSKTVNRPGGPTMPAAPAAPAAAPTSTSGSTAAGSDTPSDVYLKQLWDQTGTIDAAPPPMPAPAPIPPRVNRGSIDPFAGDSAAYGRARDKVGNETRASMNALDDEMSSRGMGTSTFMSGAASGILQKGQGELADTNRTQVLAGLERAHAVEDRDYAGDLAGRAQDISQRGQDIGYAESTNASNASAYAARRALLDRLMTLQAAGGRIY